MGSNCYRSRRFGTAAEPLRQNHHKGACPHCGGSIEKRQRSSRDAGGSGAVPPDAARAAPRAFRVRPIGRCGLGGRTGADLIAVAPLVNGFSEQRELVGSEARQSALKRLSFPIWICPIRPNSRPEGLSPNKDSGGSSGKFSVWLGRAWHSGALRSPNHHLLSKLLRIA